MDLKKSVLFSIALAGATAMAAQIIFLREFLITFYGNEISIGIILSGWLAWGALGSLVLGRFADVVRSRVRLFYACQLLLAAVIPFVFLGIRLLKPLMGITTGEIVGYYPMILVTFSLLSFPCAILGFMFSLGCRIFAGEADVPAERIARAYMAESVGAIFGGAVVSYLLIPRLETFVIVFIISLVNAAAALFMQKHDEDPFAGKNVRRVTLVLAVLVVVSLILGGERYINKFSMDRLWQGFDVLGSKDSVYGNITITKRGDQVSFYENGLHLYTIPDPLSAEQAVHFPLLEQGNPHKVLLIGGGVGGLIKEALKYPVDRVDYVELDPLIVSMAGKYLAAGDSAMLSDPRVRMISGDGRFYLKRTKEKYDCVIIALGDPYTAQLNRFYTVDFFREVKKALKSGGVVSFSLTSSPNYLGEELAAYLRSIYSSVKLVLPEVLIVPGDNMLFIASASSKTLTYNVPVLMDRMKKLGVTADYMREYYLFDVLSPERVRYARDAMEAGGRSSLNTDFRPVSYYFATVFWSTQFDTPGMRKFLRSVTAEGIWLFTVAGCALILILAFIRQGLRGKRAVLAALAVGGIAQITFQIMVILSFQVIYGYVFYKVGIMITSFMFGLAAGSAVAARVLPRVKDDMRFFIFTQIFLCLYPLFLPLLFVFFSRTASGVIDWTGSNVVFPLLPAIAGVIGGIQFPVAGKIYLSGKKEVGKATGLTYGIDLAGACIGSFLAASFLVPVLGILETCFFVAFLNVIMLVVLLIGRD
jgi:spermidine synthase